MELAVLTAFGVGAATLFGAVLGFIFKGISHKFSDIVLSFSAGVMLAAAVLGLILPSLEYGGKNGIFMTIAGIFCGAVFLNLIDKFVPHLHSYVGKETEEHKATKINKVFLFVLAIAIHNFPEGIAAGVGFGSGNIADGLLIAGGIALQNIPEGMIIIGPMLSLGISYKKTFLIAAITGVVEIIGTLIGYFTVSVSYALLPFALSFAGGTMLYVVSDEMLSETHADGHQRGATYALLVGFCVMLITDHFLG